MKAVILYDSKSVGGSTDAVIDAMGHALASEGVYVEKAKCKPYADYSFVQEFDLVILGAPVYYLVVSSQLLGSLVYGGLKKYLRHKRIGLFLTCGSSESLAALLYLPQLKIHLMGNRILAEKIFTPAVLAEGGIDEFAEELLYQYRKSVKTRSMGVQWSDEALAVLQSAPGFLQTKFRTMAEEYAEEMGYNEITPDMLDAARADLEGR